MEKNEYLEPEMEVIRFAAEDVIATSIGGWGDGGEYEGGFIA